jgi:hypothetical protein
LLRTVMSWTGHDKATRQTLEMIVPRPFRPAEKADRRKPTVTAAGLL